MATKIRMSLKQIAYLRTWEYSRRVSTWIASWIVFMTVMGLETKSSTLTIDICGRTICYIKLSLSPRMTKFWFLLTYIYTFSWKQVMRINHSNNQEIFSWWTTKLWKLRITRVVLDPLSITNALSSGHPGDLTPGEPLGICTKTFANST